jgi:uncharacterized membrane protein
MSFMMDGDPRSTLRVDGKAFLPIVAPFPFACFAGAFVTDLVYWRAPGVMWETFSVWLIFAGMIMAGVATVAALIDFARSERIRTSIAAWLYALGGAIAFVLALINALVHSRDGYTAVVPTGLTLSALVVVILLFTSWISGAVAPRASAGASI